MSAAARFRALVEQLPEGSLLGLPREFLLEVLSTDERSIAFPALMEPDLTVRDLAELFGRSPSTIRAWLEARRIPKAYKLRGREWRVSRRSVDCFLESERTKAKPDGNAQPVAVNLSDWRLHL